jgi:hypothetical protein
MRHIKKLNALQKNKIYYIDIPALSSKIGDNIIIRPKLKLKGKLWSYHKASFYYNYYYFGDLEYVNNHYDHLEFPNCKPIMLKLYEINGLLYRNIISTFLVNDLSCIVNIYEPENERILVNYIIRDKLGDPYFDYYYF